jgi:diadenosine tetraphosphate (Ap4A) HIT family hydrolase
MEHLKTNQYNYLTAKERDQLSFPARIIKTKNLIKGNVLDFGCGFGSDVKMLKEQGFNIDGYDNHYFPEYPNKKYDTILCIYVLNVLLPEEQAKVLIDISRLLKPGGSAYFAIRRDIRYEGFRTHKIYKKPTYQCNVKLPYQSVFLNENCEIYEYRHFNHLKHSSKIDCPFCQPNTERVIIAESATVYAIFDKFPVNKGHTLIIPKRHCASYFDLSFKEQKACWFMVNEVKKIIENEFNPDGFNLGININESAGQTISHVHIHLISRYIGDVENPIGGVRGVITNKQNYLT